MQICPDCHERFDTGEAKCPHCGWSGVKWVHLTTVANDIEFELLAGLLESANIPAVSKSIGVDRIVGPALAGQDVKVPEDRYEEALQLLNTQIDDQLLEEEEIKEEKNSTENPD